jgi:large subunit ribosomal protein L19
MSSVIQDIERSQLRKGLPSFDPGDRVRVHFQVVEGSRKRTQVFEGIVLRRQGSGMRETFTVRKQSFGVGVERTFPLHSPKIEKLEIAARGDVRRAKLYYLRGRIGKAARVAERRWGIDEELISAPAAAAEPEAVDAEGVSQGAEDAEVAEVATAETSQDDGAEAAGPVAEQDSSSSQAAGEEPSSTPPAEEASESDETAPEAAGADEAAEPEAAETAEAEPEAEAEEPEASEEKAEEPEAEVKGEAESEAGAEVDAEASEAGETEDNAAADEAEKEAPDDAGDSGKDSA